MKTYITLAILTVLILTGCSSTKSTADYDDVYYSTRDKKSAKSTKTQTASPDYYISSEDVESDYNIEDFEAGEYAQYQDEPYYSTYDSVGSADGGTTYITNNYYDGYGAYGDYYDYSYAARINRFYGPYSGFNYYAPCYAGFYYDPWYWDYYWYRPSLYFGFSYGWGWNWGFGWGYPYYYPYYYYPYNSYWYGYNQGYWDGYYGYNYYGYNYDGYGYYGPRVSRNSTNSPYTGSNGYNPVNSNTLARSNYLERTSPVLADVTETTRPSTQANTGPGRTSTKLTDTSPKGLTGASGVIASERTTKNNLLDQSGNIDRNAVNAGITGESSNVKMEKPQNVVTQQKTEAKPRYTYKKPDTENKTKYQPGQSIGNNEQARPTQRYSKPSATKNDVVRNNSQSSSSSDRNTQTYTRPQSNYNRSYNKPTIYNSDGGNTQTTRSARSSYSTPTRTNTSSYSQPSKTTRTYSPPSSSGNSRSYSAPSRSSSKSYSAPSSSSGRSFSSPSRSSSGGGSGSSGRSSGGRK